MNLICKQCKSQFKTQVKNRIFCSKSCYIVSQKGKFFGERGKNSKKGINLTCYYCNKSFYVPNCGKARLFCSYKCYLLNRYGIVKPNYICKICGNKISKKLGNKKYCSMFCRNADPEFHLWKKGELHHNWKEGVITENEKARKVYKYKEWQLIIFKRDNYTCLKCKKKGGTLHAHHIKHFSEFPLLRYDINNGETLCIKYHFLMHTNSK